MGCYSHTIWSQIIKGTGAELRRLDKRSRKLLTINDELHPKSDADRHCVYKNKSVLTSLELMGYENSVKSEKNNFGWCLSNTDKLLLLAVKDGGVVKCIESSKSK